MTIVSSRVSPPRQNLKFSISPQNDFSPGFFKIGLYLPPKTTFFVDFHSNLGTSNFDARAQVNWNFNLVPPWLERILKFWTSGLFKGFLVITLVCLSVCPSVCPSSNISETAHQFFLKLCMKLGVNKIKKVTWQGFRKKNLIQGIKGD